MKVIFCDFDGVCTSYDDEFGSYITHSSEFYGPSDSCIFRLKKLCKETGASIIISSNWRKFANNGKCSFWIDPIHNKVLQNPLQKLKLKLGNMITGKIPTMRHSTKNIAIREWFIQNQNSIDEDFRYVIFDDDVNENIQNDIMLKDNFILVDQRYGLSDEDCKKAKKILN